MRPSGWERREERRKTRRKAVRYLQASAVVGAVVGVGVLVGVLAGLVILPAIFDDDDAGNDDLASMLTPLPEPTVDTSGPPELDEEPTVTESGLGIVDIEEGEGDTPEEGQVLVIHYTGWLDDGTRVFSTLDLDQPLEYVFGIDEVPDGWVEGLATMKEGGTRRLLVPAELGYGEEGLPPQIPPNTDLTFDVELVEIKPVAEDVGEETAP